MDKFLKVAQIIAEQKQKLDEAKTSNVLGIVVLATSVIWGGVNYSESTIQKNDKEVICADLNERLVKAGAINEKLNIAQALQELNCEVK